MNLGTFTNKLRHKIRRLITELWYRQIFKSIGRGCTISSPVHYSSPENIEIGNNVFIGPYCRVETFPRYADAKTSPHLSIGNGTCIQHAVHLYCANSLILEEDVLIASGCMITDNNHGMNPEAGAYLSQPLISKPTILKRGVWLGENVCVVAGACIGEWSIIGSNSVVNGQIPSYSIAVGSPAKVIKKYCFDSHTWVKST